MTPTSRCSGDALSRHHHLTNNLPTVGDRRLLPKIDLDSLSASAVSSIDGGSNEAEQLHSTLKSEDSTLLDADTSVSTVSTLSMGTTVADNVFQEGLAQLDANIARLQQSLMSSRLSSTL